MAQGAMARARSGATETFECGPGTVVRRDELGYASLREPLVCALY